MITKIEIDGFKTFNNFKIELSPFVIIAGANGSGKSNLFDAILLLSRLAETDLKSAFQEQRGEARELFTQYPDGNYAKQMRFIVEVLVDREVKDSWGGEKKLKYTRLKYTLEISRDKDKRGLDRLYITKEELLPIKKATDKWCKHYAKRDYWIPKIKGGRNVAFINTEPDTEKRIPTIYLRQDGTRGGKPSRADEVEQTVLSGVANTEFPHAFAMREEMRRWKLLQLNPVKLRKPSPILAKDFIGADGSNLPAALARMKAEDLYVTKDISREINNLLPGITAIDVEEDRSKDQYVLISISQDGRKFSSRVLSEGTLRVLALLVFKLDIQHKGVLCFEEPENGIHPFRLENLTTLLRELASDFENEEEQDIPLRQLIINTHPPILVGNFFKNHELDCNILYATLFSKVDPQKKQALRFTKMIPVTVHPAQSLFDFGDITEQEQKITLSEVQKYLQTKDFEGVLTPLLSQYNKMKTKKFVKIG
ncbi:hypothetical protein PN36_16845 [Candidatus Thiomargarita nelsonii]|uniref:ATPase AAA-type core domain-containing protein n=1 Tax=Candidatus Thiomargarita nelsonii TaxID=1003181 RepID=A0A0A6PE27_9GAMM|nr:hypothetical protein PN36_16845 [Candidatus Thiomargarita nelsonii]